MSLTVTGDWGALDPSDDDSDRYVLRLYVAGASVNSSRAITNLKAICEAHLAGRYTLEIIDVQNDSETVAAQHLIALPLLLRVQPAPERRLIGDMSNKEKVLTGLGLK